MSILRYFHHRSPRRPLRFRAAPLALLALTALVFSPHLAHSLTEFQPIDIATEGELVPGEPLDCRIELQGGPATVTVYSDPPGAVSFSGTVTQATSVVQATTSEDISGPVTLYLVTDGATSVQTDVLASDPIEPIEAP